jgi:hypothetical protein
MASRIGRGCTCDTHCPAATNLFGEELEVRSIDGHVQFSSCKWQEQVGAVLKSGTSIEPRSLGWQPRDRTAPAGPIGVHLKPTPD